MPLSLKERTKGNYYKINGMLEERTQWNKVESNNNSWLEKRKNVAVVVRKTFTTSTMYANTHSF